MNIFNIGDRVRNLCKDYPTGTVIKEEIERGGYVYYSVRWDSGKLAEYGWNESIELISGLAHDPEAFKVGDKVRLKLNGKEYIVEKVTECFTFISGCGGWYSYNLEKVEEMSTPKFKVGDYVKISTKLSQHPRKILKVITRYEYQVDSGTFSETFTEPCLEKVEKKEKPVFNPKFKIGDRVYVNQMKGVIESLHTETHPMRYEIRYDIGTWDYANESEIFNLEEVWE